MRVLLQRVKQASVTVEDEIIAKISQGLVVFACAMKDDTVEDLEYIVRKIPELRIFSDDEGKFNRSLLDIEGDILLISQFTLSAQTKKGRRPYFADSAEPAKAKSILALISEKWKQAGLDVKEGVFGAMMEISLVNDGPVTIWIDSKNQK